MRKGVYAAAALEISKTHKLGPYGRATYGGLLVCAATRSKGN